MLEALVEKRGKYEVSLAAHDAAEEQRRRAAVAKQENIVH